MNIPVEIKLTNQQIAKYFANYIGQAVLMWKDDKEAGSRTFLLTRVGITECSGYFNEDDKYITAKCMYDVSRFFLKLKLISKISDEDATAVAKILFPDNSIFTIRDKDDRSMLFEIDHKGSTEKSISFIVNRNSKNNDWFKSDHYFTDKLVLAFQHLASLGYAIPFYFGVDHPLNGKTAFDLGFAVE